MSITKPSAPIYLQPVPQASGLAFCALMYEGSGAILRDVSATANNATLPTSAMWGAGPFSGPALNFNNDAARVVTLPSTLGFKQTGDFSVSLWVKLNSLAVQEFAGCYSPERGWFVSMETAAGPGKVRLFTRSGLGISYFFAATALTTGVWHHVVWTFDSVGNIPKVYIDGTLDNTGSAQYAPSFETSAVASLGGSVDGGAKLPIDGLIDAFAIYNYVLPASGGSKDSVAGIFADPFVAVRGGPPPFITPAVTISGVPTQTRATVLATVAGGAPPYTTALYGSTAPGVSTTGTPLVTGASRTPTATGLTPATPYYFKVKWTDSLGQTATSNEVSGTTAAATSYSYEHFTDPAVCVILDDCSAFTLSGTQVTGVTNVGPAGATYNAVSDTGTVTLGTDVNGYKYLTFDGSSSLKIPTSTGFDALFTNTGNAGGCGLFVVFDAADGTNGFLLAKVGTDNMGGVQACLFNGGGNGYVQRFQRAVSHRPYHGGPATMCVANETSTNRTNLATENPGNTHPNYRDGTAIYFNGAPVGKYSDDPQQAASATQDLSIGRWTSVNYTGKIRAVVCWNRCPKHHEVLAVDRYYRARYGMAETLTNQPFALICESNSESTAPQSDTEPGPFDRAIVTLRATTNACFGLGRGGRSGSDIVFDYPTWTAPLIAYLRSLGMTTAVHLWELINNQYAINNGPGYYVQYYNLVKNSGAKFSVSTAFSSVTYSPSYGSSGVNTICAANNQVYADGITYGYPVSGLGSDVQLGNYNASYYSDGLHWQSPAVAIGAPYFVTAIAASLPATPTTARPGRWFPISSRKIRR